MALVGGRTLEARMHRRFDSVRLHSEWFQLSPELRELILDDDNPHAANLKTAKRDIASSCTANSNTWSLKMQTMVIDRFGTEHGPFPTAAAALAFAQKVWPDQEQDEDGEGIGWDLAPADRKS